MADQIDKNQKQDFNRSGDKSTSNPARVDVNKKDIGGDRQQSGQRDTMNRPSDKQSFNE